jgi:hypothetical protein
MKLLFIYGPPAAGKLTVSNEIATRTGFKVFHNHLTIDAIRPVFEFGTPSFGKLVSQFRIDTIAEAARENVDLIYTFCYAKPSDDSHIRRVIEAVESNGGELCPVLLFCSREELERRVRLESRQSHTKISTPETLNELLETHDLFSTIPDRDSLVIDNSALTPSEVAESIIGHYKLAMESKYKTRADLERLVHAFETATIARDDWKHEEHLVVAAHYLWNSDFDTATAKMKHGILNLLERGFGVDLTKEMPYHETLTIFWMRTVADHLRRTNGATLLDTLSELVTAYDKDYPLRFYSRELLFSDDARRAFVGGDLRTVAAELNLT